MSLSPPAPSADAAARRARERLTALLRRIPRYDGLPGAAASRIDLARTCKLVVKRTDMACEILLPCPSVVAVLDGTKTVHLGGRAAAFGRGRFLVVPHNLRTDMVNEPCPETGVFRTVVVEILPRTLRGFQTLYPEMVQRAVGQAGAAPDPAAFGLAANEALAEAFAHVVTGLVRGERSGPVVEHRLHELILTVIEAGGGGMLFTLTGRDVADDAKRLIALDPAQRWSAEEIAARLGLSVSTLSRRLRERGENLRILLEEARMGRAYSLLRQGAGSIAEVARACGYESHSRFSARFRERYRVLPSEVRRQGA